MAGDQEERELEFFNNTYILVHPEMYTYQLACPSMWWEVQWNISLPESAD